MILMPFFGSSIVHWRADHNLSYSSGKSTDAQVIPKSSSLYRVSSRNFPKGGSGCGTYIIPKFQALIITLNLQLSVSLCMRSSGGSAEVV